MSVNDNHNDDLERDPQLAQLLAAALREEPPLALDAAILAAARREVHARPQVAGGGGEGGTPPVRVMPVKRNWYVPVSIAAMLVLSVSLVTLVHQEKGDELAQPPAATRPLPKVPAPVAAPAAEAPVPSEKTDAMLREVVPAKPKLAEEKRAEPADAAKASPAPEAYGELAKKQRAAKTESAADSVLAMPQTARKDQPAGGAAREQGPASETAAAPTAPSARRDMQPGALDRPSGSAAGVRGAEPAPGATFGGLMSGTRRPDPFPATRERESPAQAAPAPATPPAQPSRDALEARQRNEADRNLSLGTMQDAPATARPPAPPAAVAAAPRRVTPGDDRQATRPAPPVADAAGRSGSATLGARGFSRETISAAKEAPAWRGLEDQPAEKWLERLAEFKRDGRQTDADELLAEFRRRFPDHPASVR